LQIIRIFPLFFAYYLTSHSWILSWCTLDLYFEPHSQLKIIYQLLRQLLNKSFKTYRNALNLLNFEHLVRSD
jgi:hypothetical protein